MPSGRFGSDRPARRAADGVGHRDDGLVLADHALVQLVFHLQQLVALALHQLAHRDAGGARHHLGDLLGADHGAQQLRAALPALAPLALPVSLACASFSVFSSSGSLPYCSSATLLKSPLRLSSSIWSLICSISSLTWAEPCAAAFSAFQISSRSAYSRCSLAISSSIRPRRFFEASSFSLLAPPRARSSAGSAGGRACPSPRAWSRSRS